jgi:tagatose-1,6-bisphosphate aldolase non-catalytic subunit AgaZ/GatZ
VTINMRQLSSPAFVALEQLSAERGWPEITAWMEPETVAWLVCRLEFVHDTEVYFPGGKWATIQHIQTLVREAARREANDDVSAAVARYDGGNAR